MEHQMSVKQWIFTLIIMVIPVVNIIFLFLWAFGPEDPRRNYSRALLIVSSFFIGLALILGIFGALLDSGSSRSQTSTSYSYEAEEAYRKQQQETLNKELQITDIAIEPRNDGSKQIVGRVKNTSTTNTYEGLVIECNVYDKDNSILQTIEVIVRATIPPNETVKFEEWFGVPDNAYSVKSINIRNKTIFDN